AGTYTLSIAGTGEDAAATGDLDITGSLEIVGAGAETTIIDADDLDRIFQIIPGASLMAQGLTIRNGNWDTGSGVYVAPGGTFILNEGVIADNIASSGGGVFSSGNTTIRGSLVVNNSSSLDDGGGLFASSTGIMILENSTVANNGAANYGGGLVTTGNVEVSITNVTFAGNSAEYGGGLATTGQAEVDINNVTFAGNSAEYGGGVYVWNGTISVQNTIVANSPSGENCEGKPIVSLGNNLSSDGNCNFTATGDLLNADPLLGPLSYYGGPTQTMALLSDSPAIDAGNNDACAATDQRGVSRPQGDTCDIGAFEFAGPSIFVVTNTNDSGDGSLRQAILHANAASNSDNDPDEIQFDIPVDIPGAGVQTIAPFSVLPVITDPVVIDGYTQPGASGNDAILLIELSGMNIPGATALNFGSGSDGSSVRGLIINNGFGIGILVNEEAKGISIRSNSIHDNTGLGIDLAGDGVTFNHAGVVSGPNNYQNYPVLSLATSDGSTTRVGGALVSNANQSYTIDIYTNPTCAPSWFGEGQTYMGSFEVTTDASGVALFDQTVSAGTVEPYGISATATGQDGTSEFSYCRPVATPNLNWVQAQTVSNDSQTQQFITDRFQEKWFKFSVQPGQLVHVKLTSLPGSAVSLHRDPFPIYNALINPENATLLSAEAADTAFLPSGSLPSGSLPSGSLPSGSLPSGSLESDSLPTGYLPSGSLPSGSLPSGSLPSGSLPSGSLPSGSLPSGSLPSGSLPSGSLPSGSLPSGSLPSGSLPSGSLPSGSLPSGSLPSGSLDAYASAARRSLLGISMNPYATVQTIDRNTYDLREDLYVRVVGPFDLSTPFKLEVTVEGGICDSVQPVPSSLAVFSGTGPASGSYNTLILTDSGRLHGTSSEITTALSNLGILAGRSDVNGVVIDLNSSQYPRVAFANAQADQNMGCPFAKNTAAAEIKKVIDAYWSANSTLEYIVLAGGADVIPFFQVPDVSGLANERDYVVPVAPMTASEAGLETNLVQGQDGYGSQVEITQAGHTLAYPGLATGRLVDTASDVSAAVNAYIQTDGVIEPNSSLVTGYDFVGDAAEAVKTELDAGTNSTADTLIQPVGEAPAGPNAWTADQLRTKLLAGNFDIAMLSGHFSAGSLLAADYTTQLSAAEISVDLTGDLFFALGCHGGYTIPSSDLLVGDLFEGASPDPDWAKAFLRMGAAGYISATGYAYGDTELTEYGERLFLLMVQQLRTGEGPVSVGQAIVKAKQQYLAEKAQLTGIDQKTIVEMTLYGLPMMKVNMLGERLPAPSDSSIVSGTTTAGGSGASFGLSSTVVTLAPEVTTEMKSLLDLSDDPPVTTVTTTYLTGPDGGVVANPFEPIYPKAIYNVSANGLVLRGVAFRGGSYSDETGVVPLTTSPTTETSTAHLSYNTEVFYPTQIWSPNYYDAFIGGNTQLVIFPAQFQSSEPGAIDGTRRTFSQLNLELYYLPSNWTASSSSAVTKAAAVSAAPVILGASALESGGDVTFSVNAVTDGSAGVQAVWVLYTGKPGSSLHGAWLPLDLTMDLNDPTLWQDTFTLPSGANADDIRFMVQAVGGAGLTTLATNLGAYYRVTPENAPQFQATEISLLSPPSSGTYLHDSTFNLLLTADGQPLEGKFVTLDIGGQQALAKTDENGMATIPLKPVIVPGDYTIQTSFRGDANYLASTATNPFALNKDSTSVTVTPESATVLVNQPTPFVAVVKDSFNRPLGGRSVFFVVYNNGTTFVRSVIADYLGNAPLGAVPLPTGSYTVDVYFNGLIPVGTGQMVTLSDNYYKSSGPVSASFTIVEDTTPPTITASATNADNTSYIAGDWTNQTVTVHFTCSDAESGVADCPADQLFSTDGSFTATGTATDVAGNSADASFGPIMIDKTAPTLSPSVSPDPVSLNGVAIATAGATDSGSGVATQSCGPVSTDTIGTYSVTCTATDNAGNTATATVNYQVVYNFIGFFDPVENPPTFNLVKSGRAVPIKFSLNGDRGMDIFAPGYPRSEEISCDAVDTVNNVNNTLSDSASSLSYDSTAKQYNYVWKTEKSWSGSCRQLIVGLIDGQSYMLNFKFK
ncbi:MAG: PxKF domain-containing protein, partial [Anaerolineales bacterium]